MHQHHVTSQPAPGARHVDNRNTPEHNLGHRRHRPRFLDRRDVVLKLVQRPAKTRRKAVRQKREGRVALRAVPSRNVRISPRRVAHIRPVPCQRTVTARVKGAAIKGCSGPGPCRNIGLAGQRHIPANLHGTWPARASTRGGPLLLPRDSTQSPFIRCRQAAETNAARSTGKISWEPLPGKTTSRPVYHTASTSHQSGHETIRGKDAPQPRRNPGSNTGRRLRVLD